MGPPSQSLAGLVSFAKKRRHGPEGGIEAPAQRYEARAHIRTLVAWSKAPIQPAAHSELCWSQCLEYARSARTTARAAPARNRRSFRCKGSADIVLHTELAGTTA